jgi:hypothetical protein
MHCPKLVSSLLAGVVALCVSASAQEGPTTSYQGKASHVLLISIDGMHSLDFQNCVRGISSINLGNSYCPNLAELGTHGINYLNAQTSKPSDSFPGLTAIVSGGSPRTEGAYYDVAYDRVLAPPAKTTGNGVASGPCTAGQPNGTRTEYEEGIDKDQSRLDGGGDSGLNSIDPQRLPRDPYNNCAPIWPWNFVRTNTIFGVAHAAGLYTAWSDKHPAYLSVSGPGNGKNVDDFFGPEINSSVVALNVTTPGPNSVSCNPIPDPAQTGDYTTSFVNIRCYDTVKVNAILNEIDGKDHTGARATHVPAIFGMNFQAVSVGEKLIEGGTVKGGYLDAQGTPSSELVNEIQFVDAAIGEMVSELKKQGLYDSTVLIITAKHGQSPIDPHRFRGIPGSTGTGGTSPATLIAELLPFSESPNNPAGIGPTEDDISLLWLSHKSDTQNAVNTIEANGDAVGMGEIFYGRSITTMFNAPGLPPNGDPRTPDIIVAPNYGVIYTGSSKKQEEHGGFSHDDTNVMLLVSNPNLKPAKIEVEVQTSQIAPTILTALGLSPDKLQAVEIEGTPILPVPEQLEGHE